MVDCYVFTIALTEYYFYYYIIIRMYMYEIFRAEIFIHFFLFLFKNVLKTVFFLLNAEIKNFKAKKKSQCLIL